MHPEQVATHAEQKLRPQAAQVNEQLLQMSNLGGMTGLMEKLPGMNEIPDHVKSQVNDRDLVRLVAIINSMTPHEREFPAVIKGSRKRRIAESLRIAHNSLYLDRPPAPEQES